MATTTNYSWTTPDDTALVKDGAAAIRSLGTAIDTTTFNNASAAIAKAIVDAKGDIIAATAADTVSRLAVGANDTVLTADSSAATGLKWAATAAGGMTLLSTTNLLGATVSISSISTSYNKLFVLVRNPSLSSAGSIFFKFNTSTVPLLSGVNNGTAYAAEDGTFLPSNSTNPLILQFEIGNYANGSYAKSIIGSSCGVAQSDGAVWGGYINTNTAITNITFTATSPREYEAGDVLIYGVK
jgi:hypothetical protein